jgi:hypothetical protein
LNTYLSQPTITVGGHCIQYKKQGIIDNEVIENPLYQSKKRKHNNTIKQWIILN